MNAFRLIAARELSDALGARALVRFLAFGIAIPLIFLGALRVQAERPAVGLRQRVEAARAFLIYLDVLPASAAVNVAATAFAVEFESGTIVPLLATPIATAAIFWGKCLASLALGSVLAWLGQGLLWALYRPLIGIPWPLGAEETTALVALAPVFMLPPIAASILMGSRAQRVRAAQAGISLVSIPLVVGSVFLAIRLRSATLASSWPELLGWAVLAMLLIALGVRRWNREELLARLR